MGEQNKTMKILLTFLKRYKNTRRLKSSARQKDLNKLEFKNLNKI